MRAAIPRPLSRPLTVWAAGRGAAGRVAPGDAAAAGREGAGAAAAAAGAAAAEAAGAAAAALTAAGAGILMVGEAVGFGGRLMRTVSFFGWTLAASAGFGGTGAAGCVGLVSDIRAFLVAKLESDPERVKPLIDTARSDEGARRDAVEICFGPGRVLHRVAT